MGKLNEITSKFTAEVFSSFDENSLVKDYPVAKEFLILLELEIKLKP